MTFIENDFGSDKAKSLVYHAWWYQLSFLFLSLQLLVVIDKTKMYRVQARTLFHFSFIVILFGATLTHYFGFEGMMHIREGESSKTITIGEEKLEIPFSITCKDFTLTRYAGSRSPSEFHSKLKLEDPINNVSFDKKSRFQFLMQKIRKMPIASLLLPLLLLFSQNELMAEESAYTKAYLKEHQANSQNLAKAFGSLVVQGPVGRMKPLDTQNREVLQKLTGRSSWQGMSANQVVLGMFSKPELWKKVNIIRVKTPKLRALLSVPTTQKLVKFTDFFGENGYKLGKEVERANTLVPSRRGTFERDLIKVDERLNIAFMSYRGVLLTLFPLPENEVNKWVDFKTMFAKVSHSQVKRSTSRLLDTAYNRNYDKGLEYIEDIKAYQKEFGARVMPDKTRLKVELWFNQLSLFFWLSLAYLLLILFVLRSAKREHLSTHIKNITHINEVALTLGLTLLVIGNFLGGIWANESWGRYWGWDPKETWAYISILVYVIVLHLRLIKSIYTPYLFAVSSVLAFASILMTYFGVNFYLAGMHSYATGDPVPIPLWVYILSTIVFIIIAIAYPKRNLKSN